jgi:hypothetical protein
MKPHSAQSCGVASGPHLFASLATAGPAVQPLMGGATVHPALMEAVYIHSNPKLMPNGWPSSCSGDVSAVEAASGASNQTDVGAGPCMPARAKQSIDCAGPGGYARNSATSGHEELHTGTAGNTAVTVLPASERDDVPATKKRRVIQSTAHLLLSSQQHSTAAVSPAVFAPAPAMLRGSVSPVMPVIQEQGHDATRPVSTSAVPMTRPPAVLLPPAPALPVVKALPPGRQQMLLIQQADGTYVLMQATPVQQFSNSDLSAVATGRIAAPAITMPHSQSLRPQLHQQQQQQHPAAFQAQPGFPQVLGGAPYIHHGGALSQADIEAALHEVLEVAMHK